MVLLVSLDATFFAYKISIKDESMIIDPDFLDHWRTQQLIDELGGDELAPIYILRIWSHCQRRKSDVFNIPLSGLKALCKYKGDAQTLSNALILCKVIEVDSGNIFITGFREFNAQLFAAWANGAKGGRPKREENKTHGLPTDTPTLTHPKAIREEKNKTPLTPHRGGVSRFGDFWDAYPKKSGKLPCEKKWRMKNLDAKADEIIADIKARMQNHRTWQEGYIPNPLTYLNQERWNDEIEHSQNTENEIPDGVGEEHFSAWRKVGAKLGINPGSTENYRNYNIRVKAAVESAG